MQLGPCREMNAWQLLRNLTAMCLSVLAGVVVAGVGTNGTVALLGGASSPDAGAPARTDVWLMEPGCADPDAANSTARSTQLTQVGYLVGAWGCCMSARATVRVLRAEPYGCWGPCPGSAKPLVASLNCTDMRVVKVNWRHLARNRYPRSSYCRTPTHLIASVMQLWLPLLPTNGVADGAGLGAAPSVVAASASLQRGGQVGAEAGP